MRCPSTFARLAVLLSLVPIAARAGSVLTSASPSADSVAAGSPGVVELTFAQSMQPSLSHIMVKGDDGHRVDTGGVHSIDDDKHLAATLKTLLPGRYVVTWQVTAAAGGSAQSGSYSFTVAQ